MRILVTGGAGYIGSILVPMLLNKGHEVIVLDNFMYNQTSLLDCCNNKQLTIFRGDARDEDLIKSLLRRTDLIIPLACIVGASACLKDRVAAETTNLKAILPLRKFRGFDQPIIFPNTNSGYGVGQEGVYCDENTPLNPISYYGRLKVAAESAILNFGDCVTFRLATVFGISPRMRLDLLVNDFTYRAVFDKTLVLSEAHFKRNYIHISDVARAFLHAIENYGSMRNQTYNIGLSDANLSKLELCEEIKKQVPNFHFVEAEILKDPDQRNYIVSNAKIEATGFKSKTSLQDGIAELIRGYQIINKNQFSNI
ncbi:MAG: NAD(P)-dependent oxidoreductase [Patescibacteria group bacterium]